MSGRIDIEPDDVAQLVDELRVVGELEVLDLMRLKTVRTPDPLDRTRTDTTAFAIMAAVQWVASAGGSV